MIKEASIVHTDHPNGQSWADDARTRPSGATGRSITVTARIAPLFTFDAVHTPSAAMLQLMSVSQGFSWSSKSGQTISGEERVNKSGQARGSTWATHTHDRAKVRPKAISPLLILAPSASEL